MQAQTTKPAKTTKPASVKPGKTEAQAAKIARAVTKGLKGKQAAGTDLAAQLSSVKPAKQETKPAQQQETKPATVKLGFFIRDSARPGAGSKLFAYTMAWLQGSGLIDGGAIPRGQALKLAGQTAIQYHTTRTMRLVDTAGMISLAPGAANFFADRHHDAKERETYRTILTTGEPDGSLIKQAGAIGKLES